MSVRYIPVFPLELVLFEGEELHLHIFEPRYKRLIQDCLNNQVHFAIPTVYNGEITAFGCEAVLLSVEKVYPDGEMDISCRGVARIELQEYLPAEKQNQYSGALVMEIPLVQNEEKELNLRIADLLQQLYSGTNSNLSVPDAKEFHMVPFLHKCGMTLEQEIELAALESMYERQLFLLNHLKNYVQVVHKINEMKERIALNGHFKNLTQNL